MDMPPEKHKVGQPKGTKNKPRRAKNVSQPYKEPELLSNYVNQYLARSY